MGWGLGWGEGGEGKGGGGLSKNEAIYVAVVDQSLTLMSLKGHRVVGNRLKSNL